MLSDPDKNSAASVEDAAFYYPTRFGTKLKGQNKGQSWFLGIKKPQER
jgi:hypothetical protein